jgi:hypothetical protein
MGGEDLDLSRRDVTTFYLGTVLERLRETTITLSQNSRCPSQYSKRIASGCESTVLPLHQTSRSKSIGHDTVIFLIFLQILHAKQSRIVKRLFLWLINEAPVFNFGGVTGFRGRSFHVFPPGPPTNAGTDSWNKRRSPFMSLPIHHLWSSSSIFRRHRPIGHQFCSCNIRYEQPEDRIDWSWSKALAFYLEDARFSSVHLGNNQDIRPRSLPFKSFVIHYPFIRRHIFSILMKFG